MRCVYALITLGYSGNYFAGKFKIQNGVHEKF